MHERDQMRDERDRARDEMREIEKLKAAVDALVEALNAIMNVERQRAEELCADRGPVGRTGRDIEHRPLQRSVAT